MIANIKAFLDTIAHSEGTYGIGDDGYNVLVGSLPKHPLLFVGYARHPHIYNEKLDSTAAGRYQIIFPTWNGIAAKLGLKDFSPTSQDSACLELIHQRGALDDVIAGRFDAACAKCAKEWASLPGAAYGQHENSIAVLKQDFTQSGGTIA